MKITISDPADIVAESRAHDANLAEFSKHRKSLLGMLRKEWSATKSESRKIRTLRSSTLTKPGEAWSVLPDLILGGEV
jgi:hypothetical protein